MSEIITPSKKILVLEPIDYSGIGGGILTVTTSESKDKPAIGRLLAIGASGKDKNGKNETPPLKLKVGDLVAFRKYGESNFFLGGKEYMFVGFDDVLGVINKK